MNGILRYVFMGLIVFCCSSPAKKQSLNGALDAYFSQQFPADQPGGAVLIAQDGNVVFSKGYGLADMNSKELVTPHTLFNLGSVSKTFVANAILMLQEQKKLSVEDNLSYYFPQFKNKAIAARVKIKHLMTHTSGLPDNRPVKRDSVFYLTANDAENWFPVTQTDTLVFEPGTRYEYSNPAYNGLALIVEKVSGMKWQQFIQENIMKPSGMSFSTITDGPWPDRNVAHGYIRVNDKWVEKDYMEEPTFCAAGNGGVWSSVEELEKYELALERAQFLKPETIADSRTIKNFDGWKAPAPPFIGWSWFIGKTNKGALSTVGHTGSQGGFRAVYLVVPEKKIHVFILSAQPKDLDVFVDKVLEGL